MNTRNSILFGRKTYIVNAPRQTCISVLQEVVTENPKWWRLHKPSLLSSSLVGEVHADGFWFRRDAWGSTRPVLAGRFTDCEPIMVISVWLSPPPLAYIAILVGAVFLIGATAPQSFVLLPWFAIFLCIFFIIFREQKWLIDRMNEIRRMMEKTGSESQLKGTGVKSEK